MKKLQSHIASIERQLSANLWLKAVLLGVSLVLILGLWWEDQILKSVVAIGATFLIGIALGAFRSQRKKAVTILHQQAGNLEFSLELLEKEALSIAEQLQISRITAQIPPKISVWAKGLLPFLLVLIAFGLLTFLLPFLKSDSNCFLPQNRSWKN